ncbi:MAG: S41 family peptidase, partial [Candidatus Azobacteroides sp.]|nr:S41 family peptidase [Candidatus Azobacteroides sp.]
DIKIGDEVLEINDVNAVDYAKQNVAPYVSSSTEQDRINRMYNYQLFVGNVNEPVKLKIKNADGKIFTTQVSRKMSSHYSVPVISFKLLKDSIGYLALNNFDGDFQPYKNVFDSIYPQILKTKSLIIDVRANGGGDSYYAVYVLCHLVNEKQYAVNSWRTREYKPAYRAWGKNGGWSWFSKKDSIDSDFCAEQHYLKPVVLLTSPVTFSAAEDFCAMFDYKKRGLKIGQATGGSTGQPLMETLPGGGSFRVCTKEDTYPDGKKFVGVGIIPDIPVSPTVQSIRNGDDIVLDKAIEVLSK